MRLFYWKKWEKYQISPIAIAGLINVASLTKSHQEGNSEGEYLHVQAFGFRDIKFPAVIFRPKNAPVLPSELRKGLGLGKRSDLRRIIQGQ